MWKYTAESRHKITIMNQNGDRNTIHKKEVSEEIKTLGIYDFPSRGNKGNLDYIKKGNCYMDKQNEEQASAKKHCMGGLQVTAVDLPLIRTRYHDKQP
jgi:hypothetical protein